ncbi:signal peptidase I [Nocardioides sp. InS609-2]|uniref:signal peptidase I n=1 Tax=Nocardioides sp. InS609-2 TaxID=2760705 RepID=UPI0020BE9110|nr:signal peptidase I [Nocardioides sp. InS609-2]
MVTWIWRIGCWTVILAVSAAAAAAVLVPRLAGATPYSVLSGSMRPGLSPGTLVVVRPVEPEDIGIGTVITYQPESGRRFVTHRVVAQGVGPDGDPVFRTQGDANGSPDKEWVRSVQVSGELWYSAPWLGHVSTVLTGRERQVGVTVVAVGLLGYALLMFAAAARDRQRHGHTTEALHV